MNRVLVIRKISFAFGLLAILLLSACAGTIVLPDSTNTPGISAISGVYHGSEYNKAFKMLSGLQEEQNEWADFRVVSPFTINSQLKMLLNFDSAVDMESKILEYLGLDDDYSLDMYSDYNYSYKSDTVEGIYGPVQIGADREVKIWMSTKESMNGVGLCSELVMDITGDYILDEGKGSVVLITDRVGMNTQAIGYIVDISDRLSLILLDMQDTFDFDTFNLDTLLFNSHNERRLVEMPVYIACSTDNMSVLSELLSINICDIFLTNSIEIKVYNKNIANNLTFEYSDVKKAMRLSFLVVDTQSKNVLLAGLSS